MGLKFGLLIPIKTYTFSQAHEQLVVKPGSDGALALGMLHIIHRDGLADLELLINMYKGMISW